MKWAEFDAWDSLAQSWVGMGNVAIVPYPIGRPGRGESRYLITGSRQTFVDACRELGEEPSDLPRERASINIDGRFLMKAIVNCRRDSGVFVGTAEPWNSTCPVPGCGLKFFAVAGHVRGALVDITSASCAAGHRWPV